ncbi:tetratricopeptide repeat protein [Thermodesulfobacteriota bacterium]
MLCLFLVIATFAVYCQVQHYDFVIFDDDDYVSDNRHVRNGVTIQGISWAFTTFHASNWHPLTWLSHMLDCQLFGLNPGRHHLTNLLLHIANSLLLFVVFRRMNTGLWRSAFIAALFALHPCHVGSVAWVSERKDVLSTFFWMLTMWAYIRYVERPKATRYLLVVLFLTLGLMSKPMLVTLPFVLLLLDFWPLYRFRFGLSDLAGKSQSRAMALRLVCEKVPLFALVTISSAVTFYAQKRGGLVVALDVIPFQARVANALAAYVKYIGKMIYPSKLAAIYHHPGMLPWWQIIGACLLLVTVSFVAARNVKKRPYFAVGWLWYIGTLIPVIGLVQVGNQSMADRYTYIPFIGLFIVIAWGVPELASRWEHSKKWLAALATAALAAFMVVTWKQVGHWQNSITLYEHNINVAGDHVVTHNSLGVAFEKQGRIEEAIEHYVQTLKIKPDYETVHYNLGNALQGQGRIDGAIKHYLEAL